MTGKGASLIWIAVVGAGVGLFAGIWLVPHLNRVNEQKAALDRLEREGEALAARVAELTEEMSRLLASRQPPASEDRDDAGRDRLLQEAQQKRLTEVRLLAETRDKLSAANAMIEELQAKLAGLEESADGLKQENGRLAQAEQELRERLDGAERVVEAMRTELKGYSDRVIRLEVRNRKLQEDQKAAEDRLARMRQLMAEMDNVQRRREALLSNIASRYGELADEFRTISLENASPSGASRAAGVDVSRIDHALTISEEDMRQLRTLEARAARLQKQFEK